MNRSLLTLIVVSMAMVPLTSCAQGARNHGMATGRIDTLYIGGTPLVRLSIESGSVLHDHMFWDLVENGLRFPEPIDGLLRDTSIVTEIRGKKTSVAETVIGILMSFRERIGDNRAILPSVPGISCPYYYPLLCRLLGTERRVAEDDMEFVLSAYDRLAQMARELRAGSGGNIVEIPVHSVIPSSR